MEAPTIVTSEQQPTPIAHSGQPRFVVGTAREALGKPDHVDAGIAQRKSDFR